MNPMSKILVVGSSNTDMVVKADRLPKPGETVIGGDFLMNPGGKGANQAVAAARLGSSVQFVCKIGNDIFGRQARSQFEQEGIDTRFVFTDENQPSGVALINVDVHGENCITVAPGANSQLSKADIDKAAAAFQTGDILLIQLETPIETVEYAIEKGAAAGMHVILNPAPAAKLTDRTFRHLFAITPNESEAELLTGIKVEDEVSAKAAAGFLENLGVKNVVITLGARGAYLKTPQFEGIIDAPKVTAVDTTAAGDCFSGAFSVAVSEKLPLPEAVVFACKAASVAVTRMGAQASIPQRHELN